MLFGDVLFVRQNLQNNKPEDFNADLPTVFCYIGTQSKILARLNVA